MKFITSRATFITLIYTLTTAILAQNPGPTITTSTANPLMSVLSIVTSELKSIESVHHTTNPYYESLMSDAASIASSVTSKLAHNPSAPAVYSSLISEIDEIFGVKGSQSLSLKVSEMGSESATSTGSAGSMEPSPCSSAGAGSYANTTHVNLGAISMIGGLISGLVAFLL
jgi:hypothetical protein